MAHGTFLKQAVVCFPMSVPFFPHLNTDRIGNVLMERGKKPFWAVRVVPVILQLCVNMRKSVLKIDMRELTLK